MKNIIRKYSLPIALWTGLGDYRGYQEYNKKYKSKYKDYIRQKKLDIQIQKNLIFTI